MSSVGVQSHHSLHPEAPDSAAFSFGAFWDSADEAAGTHGSVPAKNRC